MLTVSIAALCRCPFLNVHFQTWREWRWFSVPVKRLRFFQSHDITLHASFQWYIKCPSEKFDYMVVMITWSRNADIAKKTTSKLKHTMWHQLQTMSLTLILLLLTGHYCLICHYVTCDTCNQIWQKRYDVCLDKKNKIHLKWVPDEIRRCYYISYP